MIEFEYDEIELLAPDPMRETVEGFARRGTSGTPFQITKDGKAVVFKVAMIPGMKSVKIQSRPTNAEIYRVDSYDYDSKSPLENFTISENRIAAGNTDVETPLEGGRKWVIIFVLTVDGKRKTEVRFCVPDVDPVVKADFP